MSPEAANVDLTTTPYGFPAVDLLSTQVAELKGGDPLAPVTVIVRSNFVSVSVRRALAAQPGGIANVTFTTLRRLAEQMAAARLAEAGHRPVSAPLISSAVRAVLDQEPGVFEPVADHPATEQALADVYRELRAAPDNALDAVAKCSARAADVVRIYRSVRQRLSASWYDEDDLLATAADHEFSVTGPVVIHLLPAFTAAEADLVRKLAEETQVLVNVGITGDATVDDATASAYRQAGIDIPEDAAVEPPLATSIISVSDPDEEVRAAVRSIEGWMRDGVRLGRIAVLYPITDPYARLLHEHLAAAGIPVNGTPVRSIGDMVYGHALRSFLSLSDRDFRRRDVLGLLTGGAVLDGDRYVPSRAWERVSRGAGIVRGDDWADRLPRWAQGQRQRADEEEKNGQEVRAKSRRADAAHADGLAIFMARLRSDVEPSPSPQTWAEHVDWLKQVADTYLGDERRRLSWPEDEWQAAQRVEESLDRLAGLDALDGRGPAIEVFRRTLDSELEASLQRTGRPGDGVMIGHVSVAAGMVFERVAVLGMAEGRFPSHRLEDSLLPDAERAAAGGHLPLRAHRVHEDHRDLLAALAGAEEAVLTYPRGDLRRSTHQPASRWLLADAARLAGVSHMTSKDLAKYANHPWFNNIPSFAGGLAHAPAHASEQDLRLAAIAGQAPQHALLAGDQPVQAALEVVRARRNDRFTRFDGNLSGLGERLRVPDRISTTALETWAKCPRAYLFTHVLRVQPVEEPERRFEIDPLTKGSMMHAILEQFILESIRENHPFGGWSADDRDRLHAIAKHHFDAAEHNGETGRALLWRAERVRLERQLDGFLDTDSKRLADGFRPVAAEQWFDDVTIELPSGHVLRMRGSIDRIDLGLDGSAEVIDYKTGSVGTYKKLSEDDPHQRGQRLQLFVYGRAARNAYPDAHPIFAHYWFTKDDKRHGYRITEGVEADVLKAMDLIVAGIAGGVFPAYPSDRPTYGWVDCWYCTPDGLSDSEARREWERIHDDPALTGYLALIDPGDGDERS